MKLWSGAIRQTAILYDKDDNFLDFVYKIVDVPENKKEVYYELYCYTNKIKLEMKYRLKLKQITVETPEYILFPSNNRKRIIYEFDTGERMIIE